MINSKKLNENNRAASALAAAGVDITQLSHVNVDERYCSSATDKTVTADSVGPTNWMGEAERAHLQAVWAESIAAREVVAAKNRLTVARRRVAETMRRLRDEASPAGDERQSRAEGAQ